MQKQLNDNIQIILIILGLFLVLYTALVAEKLPFCVIKFFDSTIVKLIFILLIIYLCFNNYVIALIAVIAFSITMQTLKKYKYIKKNKNI